MTTKPQSTKNKHSKKNVLKLPPIPQKKGKILFTQKRMSTGQVIQSKRWKDKSVQETQFIKETLKSIRSNNSGESTHRSLGRENSYVSENSTDFLQRKRHLNRSQFLTQKKKKLQEVELVNALGQERFKGSNIL